MQRKAPIVAIAALLAPLGCGGPTPDAPAIPEVSPPQVADIDVDANRDGLITAADKADASVWTDTRGAVFLSNWDDDYHDGYRDARDSLVNGTLDLEDLAPMVIRRSPDLPMDARISVRVEPEAADHRVRLFVGGSLELLKDIDEGSGELLASDLREGDIEVLLEGVGGRNHNWDGRTSVVLSIEVDGETFEDTVMLRAAPTIFPDNTQKPERIYVMEIDDAGLGENTGFFDALQQDLPADIELYAVDQWSYYGDRWLQDNMQTGYQRVPSASGVKMQQNYLMTERITGFGLEDLVPQELLGSDFGFVYTGGDPSSLNYGGNLEIAPPHSAHGNDFPYGRVIVGGGADGTILGGSHAEWMTEAQKNYLDAQEVQGPLMELSTEWLAVGHLDEIFLFVPDLHREGRPWRVVVASPASARQELVQLEGMGGGDEVVFAGRSSETTVAAILADADLLAYNEAVQGRIDEVIDQLAAEMELTADDIIEVPVLFEPHYYRSNDFGAAYSPGMQNLVAAGTKLFIPDPEGPQSFGKDVWQQRAVENLAPTGLAVQFVDVFESYHQLMGEAHCGTNFQRTPYATEWWAMSATTQGVTP